jgi:hypothetical protein
MRRANSAEMTEFEWTALIMIGCSQDSLPRMYGNPALLNRMVVIPARAKFNNAAAARGEEHAFHESAGMQKRMRELRAANVHILLDALSVFQARGGVGALPQGSVSMRASLAEDSDPVMSAMVQFVDEQMQFGDRVATRFLKRSDVLTAFLSHASSTQGMLSQSTRAEIGRCKSSRRKQLLDEVVCARGAQFRSDTTICGERQKVVYVGCDWA